MSALAPPSIGTAPATVSVEPMFLGVEDAATFLGIGTVSFYKILNSGAIRAAKWGTRTLIPVEDLRRYGQSLLGTPPTPPS